MLFSKSGPECLAVLDWELSTIGHPFADLAAVIMQWAMPTGPEGRGLAGIDRFGFYLAFCFFRMAGILQGVKKRALDGNASNSERAMKVGHYVSVFAAAGLKAAKTV